MIDTYRDSPHGRTGSDQDTRDAGVATWTRNVTDTAWYSRARHRCRYRVRMDVAELRSLRLTAFKSSGECFDNRLRNPLRKEGRNGVSYLATSRG